MDNKYRLLKMDAHTILEHPDLELTDCCYYVGDYKIDEQKKSYELGELNQLICNLKKYPSKKHTHKYKLAAIKKCVDLFFNVKATWVPIPPSKRKGHDDYDDRLIQILEQVNNKCRDFDYRELIVTKHNMDAAHVSELRPSIEQIKDNYEMNSELLRVPLKESIVLFDDIVTKGAHFKAASNFLKEKISGDLKIYGFFLGRAIH